MNSKSAPYVLALGVVFFIAGLLRFLNFPIPAIVIALISVMAAFLSLSDLLETNKIKGVSTATQILALISFVALMIVWLFFRNVDYSFIPIIGDGFTVIGLGLVIGSFGFKEILEQRSKVNDKEQNEMIAKYKFEVTSNEYKEMEKLSDEIEKLKAIDEKAETHYKIHNGWATLYDILNEEWANGQRPFFDGANRMEYAEFLDELERFVDINGNFIHENPSTYITKEIEMYGDPIPITISPISKIEYLPSSKELYQAKINMFKKWRDFKDMIEKRYRKERSLQRNDKK